MLELFVFLSLVAGAIHFTQVYQEKQIKATDKELEKLVKLLINSNFDTNNLRLCTDNVSNIKFINYYKIPVGYGASEPWNGNIVIYTGEIKPKFYLPSEDNKYIDGSAHTTIFAVKHPEQNKRKLTLPYHACKFLPAENAVHLLTEKKKQLAFELTSLEQTHYNSTSANTIKSHIIEIDKMLKPYYQTHPEYFL